jgi:hypothetical protein
VRVPQVTFETVWDTSKFNSLWPSGAANPFVWSFEGSPTGYGTHADYMFGWRGDALQKAMDKSECFYDGCGSIKKQQMSVANQCTVKDFVGEQTDGCKFVNWRVRVRVMVLTYDRAAAAAGYGDDVGGQGVRGCMGFCARACLYSCHIRFRGGVRAMSGLYLRLHVVGISSIHLLRHRNFVLHRRCRWGAFEECFET